MEEGGPMNGVKYGLLSNLNSTFSSIITNLQQERLEKENTYSSLNRCFLNRVSGPRNI